MSNYVTIIDEIYTLFFNDFKIKSSLIFGKELKVYFNGMQEPDKPDLSNVWARAIVMSTEKFQATFASGSGKKYTRKGFFVCQFFIPLQDNLFNKTLELAQTIEHNLQGSKTNSSVWFRNTSIKDNLPNEHNFYRLNVISEYQYDEII